MQLIDTHVHINFDLFEPDLDAVAARWREAGVVRLVHSCVEPSEFPAIRSIADRYPEVAFAVGLHPLDVAELWHPAREAEILALAQSDDRVVAIGETGLDFFKADNVDQQLESLEAQLRIAHQLNLPVILHCRDAASVLAEFLQGFWQRIGAVQGVMHCWGGSPEETQWFLDLGFYISFSGTVTFKKAEPIQASAKIVPLDRLLVETDCPFLAPVPKRGEKRNEPAYVQYVAQQVAQLRQVSLAEIADHTTANACRLFRLTRPEAARTIVSNLATSSV
ncbi:TatD family hydrolase [Alkalinema sp. FACHB-956]|uniref:TatD family hydrolase n=1 Tax=Alkalinema sp. FACHB-956 TaxID=2692768 RepID=UPI001688ABB5|nr:TatD family hydrolase [Alkalinema sp. FACHB-956]MBD2329027.1 TatD family hydrolase [Alkalinema sp. FACHB-956]